MYTFAIITSMLRHIRTLLLLLVLLLVLIWPLFAVQAQDQDQADGILAERLHERIRSLYATGDFQGALNAVNSYLLVHPDDIIHRHFKAVLLAGQRRYNEAETELRSVLTLDPNHPASTKLFADILFTKQEFKESYTQYSRTRFLNPSDHHAVFMMYLCLANTEQTREANFMRQEVQISRAHPNYYMMHAAHEFMSRDDERAEYFLAAAKSIYPESILAPYLEHFKGMGWIQVE